MAYLRYKKLQMWLNGLPTEQYKQGDLIDSTEYSSYEDCMSGNIDPDEPVYDAIYQWVADGTVCDNVQHILYNNEKQQISYDNGVTWTDTGQTRRGTVVEYNSTQCGYVPPIDYELQYLTFEALEDGQFGWSCSQGVAYYSLDNGETWTAIYQYGRTPTVTAGQKVIWKAYNPKGYHSIHTNYGIGAMFGTADFIVYGNIMSMLYGDDFEGQTEMLRTYQFERLFVNEPNLISAENLILPSTTIGSCYWYMFKGCSSLVNAPALPATTLAYGCYSEMFSGCTSLETAPELPATTLAKSCYYSMFSGCTSLNYIKCLATDISATNCTSDWVNGVAASGTFVKAASMSSWTTGGNGIPSGWTIQNA